jgi:hypothetical protein
MPATHHAYEVGELVYHVMGEEPGFVTGLGKRGEPSAPVCYTVVWAETREESDHFEIELSSEPPYRTGRNESFTEGDEA